MYFYLTGIIFEHLYGFKYCCIVICRFMQKYTYIYIYIYWIHTDAMINRRNDKDAGRLLYRIFTSHFIARVRKGCVGFYCERELETKHNWNVLTPRLWSSALCLHGCSTGAWSPLCWVLAFLTTPRLSPSPTLLNCPLARRTEVSSSVQFVGLILPSNSHAEIWTRLHASAISSDI